MKTSAMVTTNPVLSAAPSRGKAERDSDQHEYQAGRRVGETLVQTR